MVIYFLLSTLIIEFIVSYYIFNKIIIAPACVISGVFIISTIDLLRNVDYWSVDLHWKTYMVICGGIGIFIFSSFIVKELYRRQHKIYNNMSNTSIEKIEVQDLKKHISLIYSIVTLVLLLLSITRIANSFGGILSFQKIISTYRYASTRVDGISLPTVVNYMSLLLQASGLIWLYILLNNYICKRKVDKTALSIVIITLMSNFIIGSRGKILNILISSIPIFYFLNASYKRRIRKIRGKYLVRLAIALVVLALSFRFTANLMGREIALNLTDHLSVNLSAPIVNLDYHLQQPWSPKEVWGYNTFGQLEKILGNRLGISSWVHNLYNPFRYVNGHPLGNVSTTFFAFYYDFQDIGVIVLTSIMGLVAQYFFERCMVEVFEKKKIGLVYIIFADMFPLIAFSFFSNKFYERIATVSYVETLICWTALKFWIERIYIK